MTIEGGFESHAGIAGKKAIAFLGDRNWPGKVRVDVDKHLGEIGLSFSFGNVGKTRFSDLVI